MKFSNLLDILSCSDAQPLEHDDLGWAIIRQLRERFDDSADPITQVESMLVVLGEMHDRISSYHTVLRRLRKDLKKKPRDRP